MADIQGSRYGRYLQAIFNLKHALTLGEALPDVQPGLDLENPRPENECFLGSDYCVGYGDVTAAALQFPQVALGFPATPAPQRPGSIITITNITIGCVVSGTFGLSFGSVAAFAAGQVSKVDTRRYQQAPNGVVRTNSGAAVPTAFAQFFVSANQPFQYREPIVLVPVPGSFEQAGIVVTGVTAASRLAVSFAWRERPLNPNELIL